MKKILILVLIAILSTSVFAESLPIAVVDIQQVINESSKGKAAKAVLEKEVQEKEAELSKMNQEVKSLKTDLEKQASVLAADALRKKQDDIDFAQRKFERSFQTNREALAKKNSEQIGKVITEIRKIISEIASEKKLSLVLEKGSRDVVYSADSLDLTKEVLSKIDG